MLVVQHSTARRAKGVRKSRDHPGQTPYGQRFAAKGLQGPTDGAFGDCEIFERRFRSFYPDRLCFAAGTMGSEAFQIELLAVTGECSPNGELVLAALVANGGWRFGFQNLQRRGAPLDELASPPVFAGIGNDALAREARGSLDHVEQAKLPSRRATGGSDPLLQEQQAPALPMAADVRQLAGAFAHLRQHNGRLPFGPVLPDACRVANVQLRRSGAP